MTTVARIIPAFEGMSACGSALALRRPTMGLTAKGTASGAQGVGEHRDLGRLGYI